jgi:myosin heavy subunit
MDVIGITKSEQNDMFQLLAGILWLGNVHFVERDKVTDVSDKKSTSFITI